MGEIVARFAGVEGEFQHLHAGPAGVLLQPDDVVRQEAEVLRNETQVREALLHGADEVVARPLDPLAAAGGLVAVGDGPVALQPDADDVEQPRGCCDALLPPGVIRLAHTLPVIERVAPQLAVGREIVGRAACHAGWKPGLVQLEQGRVRPHVAGVIGYIDRQIADDLQPKRVYIAAQRVPLAEEEILQIDKEVHVVAEPDGIGLGRTRTAQADLLRPRLPRAHVLAALERHIQGIVLNPRVRIAEFAHGVRVALPAAQEGAVEQVEAHAVLEAVVHARAVRLPVDGVDLLLRQEAVLPQQIEVNEIGVARVRAEALIGAVAVARRADGEKLPVVLPGRLQKVGEVIGCLAKCADPIGGGQRGDVHQNSTGSHEFVPSFRGGCEVLSRTASVKGTVSWRATAPRSSVPSSRATPRSTSRLACWRMVVSLGV